MKAANPVRWGILGLGGNARRVIAALAQAHNATLTSVGSQQAGAAQALAHSHPGTCIHHSYDAVLADPAVEAVYIPLPNTFHARWAVRAAAQGKHVLCEKPLSTTVAGVEHMIEACGRHGVLLMESFRWRFHPQHTRVRSLLVANSIGDVRVAHIGLSFHVDPNAPGIRLNPALGGGATWDVASYGVSIARFLCQGAPVRVYATAGFDAELDVDVSVAALLTFADGRVALLDAGMNYAPRGCYEVVGTAGGIRCERFWLEPHETTQLLHRGSDGAETAELVRPANHFLLELEHFSDAVRGRKALHYGPDDALTQVRVLAAMQRSFLSGRAEVP